MGAEALAARIAPLLTALSLAAGPGSAQTSDFVKLGGVEVRGSCPWPDQLRKGYVPLLFDLVNTSDGRREVSIRATRGWDGAITVDALAFLDPGERAELELAAPAWPDPDDFYPQVTYSVALECGGESAYLSDLGAQSNLVEGVSAGVVIARERAEASLLEAWELELATSVVDAGSTWDGSRHVSTTRANLDLSSVTFDELPRRLEAYTSLDLAMVDVRRGLPEPARLEPLLAWVRAGGDAVFAGAGDAREQLAGLPAVAGWLEQRFVLEDLGGAVVWRCGLGRLAAEVPDPGGLEAAFPGRGGRRAVEWLLEHESSTLPSSAAGPGGIPSIPDLGDLPYRTFALLLVLFALAIGPVNFFLVHRSGRPALLLITIPVTALASAALFLGYGLLHQGIDVKTATSSLALIDQRSHRGASLELRQVFVGLTPGGGLRPGAGTVVLPVEGRNSGRGGNSRYRVDETGPTRLSGRFLPPRLPVDQVILGERSARARLDVERSADGLRVTNGLDAGVRRLRLVDPEGGVWTLAGELAPGASAELVEDGPSSDGELDLAVLHRDRLSDAPATFAALLDRNPLHDDCGVESTETRGEHVLLGVLDAGPEAWQ